MYIVADDSIVVIHLLIQQMIFINCHSSDDAQMKYNLLISQMKRLTDPIDYTPIPKEYVFFSEDVQQDNDRPNRFYFNLPAD